MVDWLQRDIFDHLIHPQQRVGSQESNPAAIDHSIVRCCHERVPGCQRLPTCNGGIGLRHIYEPLCGPPPRDSDHVHRRSQSRGHEPVRTTDATWSSTAPLSTDGGPDQLRPASASTGGDYGAVRTRTVTTRSRCRTTSALDCFVRCATDPFGDRCHGI